MAQRPLPQPEQQAAVLPRLVWLGLEMPRTIHCQRSPGVRYGDLAVDWPWLRAARRQGAGRAHALAVAWEAVSASQAQVSGEVAPPLEMAAAPARVTRSGRIMQG
jgi:hypothetical protein